MVLPTRPDPVLRDLAAEVAALAASPEHVSRRARYEAMHRLEAFTLINAAVYQHVWEREVGADEFVHAAGLPRALEAQLRFRLWKAAYLPDDTPVVAELRVWTPGPANAGPLWGVEPETRHPEGRGSYKPIPLVTEEADLAKLRLPRFEVDHVAREALVAEAAELTGGALEIKCSGDAVGFGPVEWAVRFCGMDRLLLDVYDRPEFVHRVMEFFTEGSLAYQRSREAEGGVDATVYDWHTVWDALPAGAPRDRLSSSWAYVHAQSAASFSPQMYADFVQPYNERLAALVRRVYYHGCEDLSRKAIVLRGLPHLALFHVSPWTPPEPVVEVLGGAVAYEVHSHPARVMMADAEAEVRADLREREAAMQGLPHVWTLCDVESFNGHPERLVQWAQWAREAAKG